MTSYVIWGLWQPLAWSSVEYDTGFGTVARWSVHGEGIAI